MPSAALPARLARRALLVLAALLAAALLAEAGLRVAAEGARFLARRGAPAPADPGARTVLCEGDSHTYGVFVKPHEAFPARLEARLNAAGGGARHRVVNAGIPGSHSHQALDRLEEEIDRYRPQLLVWFCGVNDAWAIPVAGAGTAGRSWERLRLVRLARLLAFRLGGRAEASDAAAGGRASVVRTRAGDLVPTQSRMRAEELRAGELGSAIGESVGRLADLASRAGAAAFVVLYPDESQSHFADANAGLRAAAVRHGLAVVETRDAFARVAARSGPAAVYFGDYHPKPLGYEIVARLVHASIVEHLAPGTAPSDPLEGLELPPLPADPDVSLDRSRPDVRLVGSRRDPDRAFFEIRDRPGLAFRLFVSLSRAPGRVIYGGATIDLQPDALWVAALAAAEFQGTFDATGRARVALRPLLRQYREGLPERFAVAYAILRSHEDPWVLAASGAEEVEWP